MTILTIGVLGGLCLFLGMRLHSATIEISALRVNVASLKRRLAQR